MQLRLIIIRAYIVIQGTADSEQDRQDSSRLIHFDLITTLNQCICPGNLGDTLYVATNVL